MQDSDNAGTIGDTADDRPWPYYLVGAAALIELIGGLNEWPALAGDISRLTGHTVLGWIVVLKIAVFPLLASVALYFVAQRRLQGALLAMAAMILLAWLSYLPSLAGRGLDLQGDLVVNAQLIFQDVGLPLIACAVAFLALSGERYPLAAVLAALPTTANLASLVAFAVGLGIYGF